MRIKVPHFSGAFEKCFEKYSTFQRLLKSVLKSAELFRGCLKVCMYLEKRNQKYIIGQQAWRKISETCFILKMHLVKFKRVLFKLPEGPGLR